MSCEAIFIEQLRKRGFRLTPQRELVLLVLHETGHAATAEEIYNLVRLRTTTVELSTVYRTLELLKTLGLVTVIETGEKQHLYHLSESHSPHLHLVCRKCGYIQGVALETFQPWIDLLKTEQHFAAEISSLTISGLCAGCQAQPDAPGD
jgi:Fur family transcriptional regulator, ferric uptake regulator